MALIDRKITDTQISTNGVVSAPDKLIGTAAQNKAIFDNLIKTTVKTELNGVIDDLTATTDSASGADQIGTTAISGLTGTTVQSLLEALNTTEVSDKSATDAALALKVDKVTGKDLSTNDYTTAEQTKLSGIATGAEVNVNADWNAAEGDAQILNKPTNISGYGITDAYTKAEIDNKVSAVYKFKGNVDTYALLPSTGLTIGDVYNVLADGKNYAWTGTGWDDIGGVEALATALNNGLFSKEDFSKLLAIAGTNTGDETTGTIGTLINGATEKVTPADADMVGLMDSAASNVIKKFSWANIKSLLNTYFTDLFAPLSHVLDNNKHIPRVVATGTANTYAVTISGIASYTDGLQLWVRFPVANTGASTINIGSLGDIGIYNSNNISITSGTITLYKWYLLIYSIGHNRFIISSKSSVDVDTNSAQTLSSKTLSSPTCTGTVTIPTPTTGDNSTKAASTAFVQTALGDVSSVLDAISGEVI